MKNTELAKGIYWVGAIDWNIRDFHGYSTNRGSTYNAYLIVDDKITLVDTVKAKFKGELMHRIRSIIGDPKQIDYIVVNHVEMDHSGSLPEVIAEVQPEKLICSKMGQKALLQHFHREDWPYQVVGSGDEIKLGKHTLSFLETRMLHWPDSMFAYVTDEQLLFSNDAFGEHLATSERFDDEVDAGVLAHETTKYYANILTLYSQQVRNLLAKVAELKLDIKTIAPDHGVIWRKDPARIIASYKRWSNYESNGRALVIYDTMWESTRKMAFAVAEGLLEAGVPYDMFDLAVHHRSDVMTAVLDASALVLGCPTLNNGMTPHMADYIQYMRGLRPSRKIAACFGSYGWSGESVKMMTEILQELKMTICHPGLRVQYVPTHANLHDCVELGHTVAKATKAFLSGEQVESVV